MRFSPSNSHDRECLIAVTGRVPLELARAAVHENAWAASHADFIRSLPSRTVAEAEFLAEVDRAKRIEDRSEEERQRVINTSARRVCMGWSCGQARHECKEKCPTLAEMACTAGEEQEPLSVFTLPGKLAIAAIAAVGLLVCWLAPLAN